MIKKVKFHALKPILPVLFFSLSIAQSATKAQAASELSDHLTGSIYTQLNSDFIASYTNTGSDSEVAQTTQNTTTAIGTSDNQAEVNQFVTAAANTGYNEASRNISIGGNAGMITTGDALVTSVGVVEANNSQTSMVAEASQSPSTTNETTNTGDQSSIISHQSLTTEVLLTGNNAATIYQGTTASANTGNNVADRNISLGGQAGVIQTGDAGLSTSYLVAANNSVVIIGGESDDDGPGSGASIIVDNTGENTRFTFSDLRLNQLHQSSHNTVEVTQTCGSDQALSRIENAECVAVTGYNSSNRNISKGGDAGVITTGDATVDVAFVTSVNTLKTSSTELNTVQPSLSTPVEITNTGSNSQTNSTSSYSDTLNSSIFQDADVEQSVDAVADTGHNTANRNISIGGNAGVIATGNAAINVLLVALVNNSELFF